MTVVQGAHRRHEPDRAPSRARGRERLAQLGDRCATVLTPRLRAPRELAGALGERPVERRRARALDSAIASRWRSTVSSSPRAIGPVRASPPRSAQLAAVRRTSGASSSRASSTPIALEQLGRRLLERDEEVRRDRTRRRGRRRGARRRARRGASRAARRARAASLARLVGRARRPRTGRRPRLVAPSGTVCSGWREKVSAPRRRADASAASGVAPLTWPTRRSGGTATAIASHAASISSSGTQSSAISAPLAGRDGVAAPGERDLEPGVDRPRARASRPTRPGPTTAIGDAKRAGAESLSNPVPVLASRYQTARAASCCAVVRSTPRARSRPQRSIGVTIAADGACRTPEAWNLRPRHEVRSPFRLYDSSHADVRVRLRRVRGALRGALPTPAPRARALPRVRGGGRAAGALDRRAARPPRQDRGARRGGWRTSAAPTAAGRWTRFKRQRSARRSKKRRRER